MSDPTAAFAERLAVSLVLPLWMAAGTADYALHRRSRIEATSGLVEARLHALGIVLSTPPVLAALTLEIDAGVLALLGVGYVAHGAMTIVDIAYADGRRRIVPLEQHVHALLELLPLTALALVGVAHREQLGALVGGGTVTPRLGFRRKQTPLSDRTLAGFACAFALAVALPYVEEYLRCLRYARERTVFHPNPPRQHRAVKHREDERVPCEAERETRAR